MSNILYYPYINIPRTDWTLRTLLYYDSIGSIVPQEYFYRPEESYDPFMLDLVRKELVTPIDPIEVLENPWETTRPFIEMIASYAPAGRSVSTTSCPEPDLPIGEFK